jgi:hypothetical protein
MAKIIIQTDAGEEVAILTASAHNLRDCSHSFVSAASLTYELLKAIDEALDIETQPRTDPTLIRDST